MNIRQIVDCPMQRVVNEDLLINAASGSTLFV